MDGDRRTEESTERREPIWLTLADLCALVLGCALALFLPQMHFPTDRVAVAGFPMPNWVVWLFVIAKFAMRAGLALTPVIVARRARYGGVPRPADWLAVAVGLTLLLEFAHRTQWMKRLALWYLVEVRSSLGWTVSFQPRVPGAIVQHDQPLDYDDFPADFTPGDEHALCGWFTGLLFLTISAALVVGWKRSPGWAKTVLISAAAFTFATSTSCIQPGVYGKSLTIAEPIGPFSCVTREIIGQIAVALATLPLGLLYGIPVVAVLTQLRRVSIKSWIWTGCLGTITAFIAFVSDFVIYSYVDLVNGSDPVALPRLVARALRLVVIALTCWVIVTHLRWTRHKVSRSLTGT
jgi:hypothetical protein